MGKSPSNDELTIRNQFDRICKLALKGEAADYYRHIAYLQKHEVLFSELSQKELDSIFGVDKYTVENKCFRVLGYDIEVKDTLLAEAIQSLSENKRKVEEFDRGIFESIVEKVIVGGLDEDGNKDPYKITFIYKTGFKNEIGNAKERFGKSSGIGDKVKKMCSDISDEVKGVCSDVSLNTC